MWQMAIEGCFLQAHTDQLVILQKFGRLSEWGRDLWLTFLIMLVTLVQNLRSFSGNYFSD